MADSLGTTISSLSYTELEERRSEINARLCDIGSEDVLKKLLGATKTIKRQRNPSPEVEAKHESNYNANSVHNDLVYYDPKTDTHWDFLMKEMMWLGADFVAERKRQHGLAKKQANAIKQYHNNKEARQVRQLAEAELKRRRLSSKIARDVRSWWSKIERVIAYKQKLNAEKERRKAMNKQLVDLVRLTERYGEKVAASQSETDDEHLTTSLSIEEALASSDRLRRKGPRDYASIQVNESQFYGESTTEESGSDGSYVLDSEDDDETTLREAEAEETRERLKAKGNGSTEDDNDGGTYVADRDELHKLLEESNMDISSVLERLRDEALDGEHPSMTVDDDPMDQDDVTVKRVTFADDLTGLSSTHGAPSQDLLLSPQQPSTGATPATDQGFDADDDGDASDVEDFSETQEAQTSDGSEEFEDDGNDIDDETTIAAEERLGRDMSVDEEIDLLQKEGEMSIEDLRKRYGLVSPNVAESEPMTEPFGGVVDSDSSGESADNGEVEMKPKPSTSQLSALTFEADEDDREGEEDDYQPTYEVDDETTLEAEERLGRDMSYEDEIALLNKENEMTVEELRKLYCGGPDESGDSINGEGEDQGSDADGIDVMSVDNDDDDFEPDKDAVDDETTMEAEERLDPEMSAEDEIALLKRESETPIEELRSMYSPSLDGWNQPSKESNGIHPVAEGRKRQRTVEGSEDHDGAGALRALRESEERARSTMATRPFLLSSWVKLRRYQQTGLNWLVSIQTRRLNGILADEMGLGKTLQTITLLAYLASYKGIWGPHLVIVPTSVIINWETELKRFCPAMKVLCYYGSAKRRKELRVGWTKANCYHVVITSYQLAVQDSFAFKRKKWYYMILDEAHNIKNFQSQRWQTLISFNSQRRLLLTGTPLQNNLTELWSLLHFLMPHVFRSRKEFSYWFSNPMNSIIEGNAHRSDELISRLHEIIRPFVIRRLKKDVETQLPGKYEHIVKCQMSRRQLFLYEEFMARSSTRQALKKGGNFMGMMNVLMQLRKVCNHPDLFEPRAVVTPFTIDGIDHCLPECVFEAITRDKWQVLRDRLRVPLWCGSNGLPCPSACLDHDYVIAQELFQLKLKSNLFIESVNNDCIHEPLAGDGVADGLARHLKKIWQSERDAKEAIKVSQSVINSQRCEMNPFCYSKVLQQNVMILPSPLDRVEGDYVHKKDIVSTPMQLLAMRKTQRDRMEEADDMIKKFVFCVPKAAAIRPRVISSHGGAKLLHSVSEMLLEPLEELLEPFVAALARITSFFPDKRLVQFDAGKLQSLSVLLHELKRGGHRVLIFTQMSKMLDVLEAFLNLNGHTYLRLDGSTGVERRQRLMDKFNNDEKVFCFILSTRSGGLGINLTGADTVIFYDSDWNPAMDAQAQDRAHRIGQTRDVHIYRLITEHSIEENIFLKAKQKRNLDLIVMDEGKFDADSREHGNEDESKDALNAMYTKGGLLDILGVTGDSIGRTEVDQQQPSLSSDQVEKAMASLEDAEDAAAMTSAMKEAEEELKEFDETVDYKNDEEDDEKNEQKDSISISLSAAENALSEPNANGDEADEKRKEETMVQEFNEWQTKIGVDADAIEASLSPTERYALRFREVIDPFWSIFAIMEERRRLDAVEDKSEDMDIEELERENALAEEEAFDEGDLLATRPRPEELPRQRHLYQREKARMRASKKRRKLTGESWVQRIDALSQCPFWYNDDTGEAIWEKPKVLLELEADALAHEKLWSATPHRPLVRIMAFLIPFPERMRASLVCRHWKDAAADISFVLHVLPVEIGPTHGSLKLPNHFASISDALEAALPGDTLELGDGHYWINEPGLDIRFPLKIVGDEYDPSHVVVELSGTVRWSSTSGFVEGVTFRRPKLSSGCTDEMLMVVDGRLDMLQCVLNNHGSEGNVAVVTGAKCRWIGVVIKGSQQGVGLVAERKAFLQLENCDVRSNYGSGIVCKDWSHLGLNNCVVENNGDFGVLLQMNSKAELTKCRFWNNLNGVIGKETGSTCLPCNGNIAIISSNGSLQRSLPGFRLIKEQDWEPAN